MLSSVLQTEQCLAHSGFSNAHFLNQLQSYPPEILFLILFKLVVSMEWLLHSLLKVGEFPWWAIPLYTVCKSFWEPSKWKALYKYTLPPAASRLSTGDAFASLMYIVFHLGHCFYFYDHKRNIHSMNNNVNCIQEDIYLYVFMMQNLEIWKKSWHGIFLSCCCLLFNSVLYYFWTLWWNFAEMIKSLYIIWEYVVVGSNECHWQKACKMKGAWLYIYSCLQQ